MNSEKIKKDFPIFERELKGKQMIYLDNAATTQKPIQVIEAVNRFYKTYNSNIHRGVYQLSEEATEEYESSRKKISNFINAKTQETIFTNGATQSLNLLSNMLSSKLKKGDEIVLSEMEHHSNLIPWQQVAKRTGAKIKYLPVNLNGELDELKFDVINPKTKIVSIAHMSNVLGTINPVSELIKRAHENNAFFILDAAQSAPQMKLDMKKLEVDFMAFSGHKIMAPTGTGILFGKEHLLEKLQPITFGGDMIKEVTFKGATWNDLPWKFEAGTPNISGMIGFGAAIDYIKKIGIQNINDYEEKLSKRINKLFLEQEFLDNFGPLNKRSVFSFNIKNVHAHDVASILNDFGIAVRGGHHCAMPLMTKLRVGATTRASFYIYNSFKEAEFLIESLKQVKGVFAR